MSIRLSVAQPFFCNAICRWFLSWFGGFTENIVLGLLCFSSYQLPRYYFIHLNRMTPDLYTCIVRSESYPLCIKLSKDFQVFHSLCGVWVLLELHCTFGGAMRLSHLNHNCIKRVKYKHIILLYWGELARLMDIFFHLVYFNITTKCWCLGFLYFFV